MREAETSCTLAKASQEKRETASSTEKNLELLFFVEF